MKQLGRILESVEILITRKANYGQIIHWIYAHQPDESSFKNVNIFTFMSFVAYPTKLRKKYFCIINAHSSDKTSKKSIRPLS